MGDHDSDSDGNWINRPTQTDIDLLKTQISQMEQEKKLLNLDLSKNERLNRKRYLALIEMNKNLEKSNNDNMKLKEQNETATYSSCTVSLKFSSSAIN